MKVIRRFRLPLPWIALPAVVAASAVSGWAQTTGASIYGVVRDATRAPVPDVTVTVSSAEAGLVRVAATDDHGRYRVSLPALAAYEVQAQRSGFRTAVRKGVKLSVGREAMVDVVLEVGALSERVMVDGEASLVELSPHLGALVDDQKIRDLPLRTRSYEQLALLQPGLVAYAHAANDLQFGSGVKFASFGSRPHSNLFLLDGTDINDQADFTPGNASGVVLGIDSLREFRVLSHSYSAEFGRKSGAIVSAVSRAGTNQLHGGAFYFMRDEALDARNFFDRAEKPPFDHGQFGATLGGPLWGRKTFFFVGYEGLRQKLGLSNLAIVPNADAHRGCLPDGSGGLRCIGVDPDAQPYLDLLPLPNGRDHGDGTGEYFSSPLRDSRADNLAVRLDHRFSDRHSLFGRYTVDISDVAVPGRIPAFGSALESRYHYLTIEDSWAVSKSLLNVLRVGYNLSYSNTQATQTPDSPRPPVFVPGQDMIGSFTIDTMATAAFDGGFGPQTSLPRTFNYVLLQLSDDLSWSRGRHLVKAGFSLKWNELDVPALALNPRGSFNFRTLEDFLRADPYLFSSEAPASDTQRSWRQMIGGVYVQDDIRLQPRLVLNLGLRYEFVTTPQERHGKSSHLARLSDTEVTAGPLWVKNPAPGILAPRLGFAYDPSGKGTAAIRGGVGLYYDLPVSYFYSIAGSRTYPFHYVGSVKNPSFPNALEGIFQPGARNLVVFNTDLHTPSTLHYNLAFEKQIFSSTVVSAGYAGSHGYHLLRHEQANHMIGTLLPDGSRYFPPGAPRVNPAFNEIRMISTDANSSYNGFFVSLERRWLRGMQFQLSYTLSKSTDTSSAGWGVDTRNQETLAEDPYDLGNDRGLSAFDTRHLFTLNYSIELPFGKGSSGIAKAMANGWRISGITTASSGNPFSVVWSGNRARSYPGATRSRPNLRAGADPNPILGGPDRYFDPAAFEAQPPGFLGSLGRNTLIGPGLVTFDVALAKHTSVGKMNIELRIEAFNVFNQANFGLPLRVIFDPQGRPIPSAGQITSTVTPGRQIQFGLKASF